MLYPISLCFLVLALNADASGYPSASVTDRYIAMAIQGDLRRAHRMLDGEEQDRTAEFLELRGRFRERFVDRTEPRDPGTGIGLLDDVVSTYRNYWNNSLLGDLPQAVQDSILEQTLREMLLKRNPDAGAPGVYGRVEASIRRLGLEALAVFAPPFQDLFVWKRRQDEDFNVKLTDQVRAVKVAFLSDFVSLGWKNYAALGLATTTGWAEDGVLYCVEKSYLPGTERFEVSFLKHETRHLADLERFPQLSSADLEYRAKLTELAFASQTLPDLLDDFSAKSAPHSGSAHGEANFRVLHDLHTELSDGPASGKHRWWGAFSTGRINAAARRLLQLDTAAREAAGRSLSP